MAQLVSFLGTSALFDWATLIAEGVTALLVPLLASPTRRGFSCSDASIRQPYVEETIPTWALGVGFVVGALVLMVLFELMLSVPGPSGVLCRGRALPVWLVQLYSVITSFLCGAGFSQIATDIGKYHIGALRPHFFELCQPNVSCSGDPFRFFRPDEYRCTFWTEEQLTDSRLSFPSGHASLSFYVSTYLVLYLNSRVRDCSSERRLACFVVRPLLQGLALLAAWFTAVSRVMDNMHHPRDVVAGGLIGTVAALLITRSLKPFKDVSCMKPNEETPLRRLQLQLNGPDVERN